MFGAGKTYQSPGSFIYVQVLLAQQGYSLRYAVVGKDLQKAVFADAEDPAALVKKAGKARPYVLHFRGFGVLTRMTENTSGYKEALLVNGHEEDFYFNTMSFTGKIGASFLRRSLVNDLIDELRAAKVFIWSVNLGPIPLLAAANVKADEFRYDLSALIASGDLVRLERNQDSTPFAGNTFANEDDAYIHALSHVTQTQPEGYSDGLSEEEHREVSSNYREFLRFVKLGVGMLSLFLFALTANYFYINMLNDKAASLEADISGFGEDFALMDRLEQEKARKTVLVENSGVQSRRYLTFYLDEIGASVPASIQLETLDAFPLVEALKPKRKAELRRDQITVTGLSASSKVLDDWMEQLENRSWITGVELMNYVRISENKASFNLLIKIKS